MRHDRNLGALEPATLIGFSLLATNVLAGETGTLFCAAQQAVVCSEQGKCVRGLPTMANLPSLFKIDLENGAVVSLTAGNQPRTSKILHHEKADGRQLIQGAEAGKAWTASIDEADGRLAITATSAGEAFVVFGVCAPEL